MPTPPRLSDRSDAINRLAAQANLSDVAEWLGFRVSGRGTGSPKILCPFHDDRRPSMQLYPASGGGRAQFHCFSCGAHGDAFDLIKRQLDADFRGALEWLAERYRFPLPAIAPTGRALRLSPRARGLELGLKIYRRQLVSEVNALREWAKKRRIEFDILHDAEVFAALPPKISKSSFVAKRDQFDALDAAGLLRRETRTRGGESAPLPIEIEPRDFYDTPRVLDRA